jgi:hypothetical protein
MMRQLQPQTIEIGEGQGFQHVKHIGSALPTIV